MAYAENTTRETAPTNYPKTFLNILQEGKLSIPAAACGALVAGTTLFLAMNDQLEGVKFGVATFAILQTLFWVHSLGAYFIEKMEPLLQNLSLKNLIGLSLDTMNILMRSLSATGAILLVNSQMRPQKEGGALFEDFKIFPLFLFAVLALKTLAERLSVSEYAKKFNALLMELFAIMVGGIVTGVVVGNLIHHDNNFMRRFIAMSTAFVSATAVNFIALESFKISLLSSKESSAPNYHRVPQTVPEEDADFFIINAEEGDKAPPIVPVPLSSESSAVSLSSHEIGTSIEEGTSGVTHVNTSVWRRAAQNSSAGIVPPAVDVPANNQTPAVDV